MKSIFAALTLSLVASTAMAAPKCDTPKEKWQPKGALQKQLEGEGWKVKKIKTENGCYEAYATKASGEKLERFFDPVSFKAMGDDK